MKHVNTSRIGSLIDYDWKHPDTSVEYEYAAVNVFKERQLKDIATDCFIEQVFSDTRAAGDADVSNVSRRKNRENFLAYVYSFLNLKLKSELPPMLVGMDVNLLPNEDVYLIFKGGSMMYYQYEKSKASIKSSIFELFKSSFDQYFKISDFDFTVYITVRDRKAFAKVKKAVNKILYQGLVEIRDFFEGYLAAVLGGGGKGGVDELLPNFEEVPGLLTKSMTIVEAADSSDIKLFRYYLYVLRQVVHMRNNAPTKLSVAFMDKYNKKMEDYMSVVQTTGYDTISTYVKQLVERQRPLGDVVADDGFHVHKLLIAYEFITLLHANPELLVPSKGAIQELLDVFVDTSGFFRVYVNSFAKHMKAVIITDQFYTENTLSDLVSRVEAVMLDKEIKVCLSVYDDFAAINNAKLAKDESTYEMVRKDKGVGVKVSAEKREDFYIQPDHIDEVTMYTEKKSENYHYVYLNSTIKKERNMYASIVDFDLLRVKFNLSLKINGGGGGKALKIPSEFIDISICGYDDTSLVHFRNHTMDALALFTIPTLSGYELQCLGYSLKFMIHDLLHVLYHQNIFTPWVDQKYVKRIYRLTCLEMLLAIEKDELVNYINSLVFMNTVLSKCVSYVSRGSSTSLFNRVFNTVSESEKVFTYMEINIEKNYEKYDFKRITYMVPNMLVHPISKELGITGINDSMPYPDEIIGSILLYAMLLKSYIERKDSAIMRILNRYRVDFQFYDLEADDIDGIVMNAAEYLDNLINISDKMLNLARRQMDGGAEGIEGIESVEGVEGIEGIEGVEGVESIESARGPRRQKQAKVTKNARYGIASFF